LLLLSRSPRRVSFVGGGWFTGAGPWPGCVCAAAARWIGARRSPLVACCFGGGSVS
jgi:hypothetical protein